MRSRSIADVQKKLKAFDAYARHTDDTKALQKKWHQEFGTELSDLSAKSFVTHYREMRSKSTRNRKHSKSRRQHGGVAPLDYVMTPGSQVSVYGRFPVEVDTDPGSIKDLDVYFQDALTLGCGNNNEYWPTVPANMGSNQVGGRGRSRNNRRRTMKRRNNKRNMRKTMMMRRRQRGGDIFGDLTNAVGSAYTGVTGSAPPSLDPVSRPFFASVYPNVLQTTYNTFTGATPDNYPAPPEPEIRQWDYISKGTSMAIPPQSITSITADFNKNVTPPIYPSNIPPPSGVVSSGSSSRGH